MIGECCRKGGELRGEKPIDCRRTLKMAFRSTMVAVTWATFQPLIGPSSTPVEILWCTVSITQQSHQYSDQCVNPESALPE